MYTVGGNHYSAYHTKRMPDIPIEYVCAQPIQDFTGSPKVGGPRGNKASVMQMSDHESCDLRDLLWGLKWGQGGP